MIGVKCKYDDGFKCFLMGDCLYPDQNSCFRSNLSSQAQELEHLKHRQMQKHNDMSAKWRSRAQYFEKKAKQLEIYLMSNGIDIPSSEELRKMSTKEETGEKGIRDIGEEAVERT